MLERLILLGIGMFFGGCWTIIGLFLYMEHALYGKKKELTKEEWKAGLRQR